MRRRLFHLLFVAIWLCSPPCVAAQGEASQKEATVRQFLTDFLAAFDNLDWDKFRAAFADDAMVFFPRGWPNRADGRAEIEAHFKVVFEQIRAGRTKGPYMDLKPENCESWFWAT